MKVLHVCETAKGGTATYLATLIPLLCEHMGPGNVRLLLPQQHRAELSSIDPSILSFFDRPGRLKGLPHFFVAVFLSLRRFRPDVVHAHSTFAGIVSRLLSPFFRVPVVYCPHGWAMDIEQGALQRRFISWIEVALSFLCRKIIAVSEHERRRGLALGLAPGKIVTIYNGLACEGPCVRAAPWDDARLNVLFAGRLDRQKGPDILLRAVEGLEDRLSVRLIGAPVRGDATPMTSVGAHVAFLGWQSRDVVAAHMKACDVVVVPSRWEGFGYVALEAMQQAKPVIASSVGGLLELVEDGKTGILFPPGDAGRLKTILATVDRSSLREMGLAGRRRFLDKFTAARLAPLIEAVYAEAVHG
ncbi:MAG: glycosyltransferase [Alphaproteobacteria bacterium]|nr:glycosyltransferase [Alphaproteobacteria bacterium]